MNCPICQTECVHDEFYPDKLVCPKGDPLLMGDPTNHVYIYSVRDGYEVETLVMSGYRIHRAKIHEGRKVPLTSIFSITLDEEGLPVRMPSDSIPVYEVNKYLSVAELTAVISNLMLAPIRAMN